MISNEAPQGSHSSAMSSVLHRLSVASQGPIEHSRAKIEKAIDPFEAKIKRMTRGVHKFKNEWVGHTDKTDIINNIVGGYKTFVEAQTEFKTNSAIWGDYRSEKELTSLEIEIKKAKLDVMLTIHENGPEHVKSLSVMKDLERQMSLAQTARKTIEQRHLSQEELSKQELTLDEAHERYQTQLCGFLFSRNKELFLEKKSTDAFSTPKESRQIEGVVRALNGEHLHMGTGEGKSTTVLPIASLVEAATNGENKVIVGSANSLLIEELKENTLRMSKVLSELSPYNEQNSIINGHDVKSTEDTTAKSTQNELTIKKNRETLVSNTIENDTEIAQKERYWEGFVRGTNMPSDSELGFLKDHQGSINIYFADEKQLVWEWMANKEKFSKGCPTIFMDEAHVPFDKNTAYSRTSPAEALKEADIQTGTADWLVHYIVAGEMKQMYMNKSLLADKGGYELTEQARDRIREIKIEAITHESHASYAENFYNGVGIIADHFNISGVQERLELEQKLLSELKFYSSNNETISGMSYQSETPEGKAEYGTGDLFENAGTQVARYMRLQGKDFMEKNGKVTIRDSYVDELLEEHKFNPDVQVAVLAVAGVFEPIKRDIAFSTTTYPSFVHAMKDKFIGFSGTLMYPDARQNKMKKGSFASFLEETTERSVHMVETPEIKQFPKPNVHQNREEMFKLLSQDLKFERGFDQEAGFYKGRPTLLVDFNGLESAVDSFNELKKIYGENRVRLLQSKPTGGDKQAELDYKEELDECRRQLSDGEIDALVSSGSAALGVNFEKSDGSFPDLRTVMIGMPDSEQRIAQTIGRRRMSENGTRNHLWYMNTDDLELQLSLFENQTKKYYIGFKKSRQQMMEVLMRDKSDPEKSLNHTLDIMSEMRAGRSSDTDFQINFDHLVDTVVLPHANSHMKRKIAEELLQYDKKTIDILLKYDDLVGRGFTSGMIEDPDVRLKKRILDEYFNFLGLPSTLHTDILKSEWRAALTNKEAFGAHYVKEQNKVRMNALRNHIFDSKSGAGFNIDAYLDDWFEGGKESTSHFAQSIDIKNKLEEINKIEPGRKWIFASDAPLPEGVNLGTTGIITESEGIRVEKRIVLFHTASKPMGVVVLILHQQDGTSLERVLYDPTDLKMIDMMQSDSSGIKLHPTSITYTMKVPDEGGDYVTPNDPPPMKDLKIPLIILSTK